MSYAVRNDGQGWRSVNGPDEVGIDETYSESQPVMPPPTPQEIIKKQIVNLEATITDRRMREAVLGIDGGWLKGVNDQITVLRVQLL